MTDAVRYMTESPTGALVVVCLLGIYVGLVLIGWALGKVSFQGCKPAVKQGEGPMKKIHRILLGVFGVALGGAIAGFSGWNLYKVLGVPKVVVWTGLEEDELRFFEKTVIPGFEEMIWKERQRWVQVEVMNKGWPQTLQAFRDGKRVDVITFDINGARERLISEGLIEELSKCRELVPSSVHPTLLEASGSGKKRYFIPYRPNVRLLFLNKDKYRDLVGQAHALGWNAIKNLGTWDGLRESGEALIHLLDRDRCEDLRGQAHAADCNAMERLGTWKGLQRFAKKLRKREQREEGVLINAKGPDAATFLLELVWSAGGDPCDLGNEKTRQAIDYLRDLWPYVSKRSEYTNWQTTSGYLLSGKVALARNWTMQLSDVNEAGEGLVPPFDVGQAWRWNGRPPACLLGGEVLALAKESKNEELAMELIRYLVSKEVQEKIVAELSWPAMRLDVLGKAQPWQHAYLQTINEALLCARPVPSDWYPYMATIYEDLFRYIVERSEDNERLHLQEYQQRIDCRNCTECIQEGWAELLEQESGELEEPPAALHKSRQECAAP